MSYSGNPANYPASFPLLSDHVPPKGSEINVPLEALGDRTANLDARISGAEDVSENLSFRTVQALNWGAAKRIDSGHEVFGATWDPDERAWCLHGEGGIYYTDDDGDTWWRPIAQPESFTDVAMSPGNSAVAATRGRYVWVKEGDWDSTPKDIYGAAATEDAKVTRPPSAPHYLWFGQGGTVKKISTTGWTSSTVTTLSGGEPKTRCIASSRTTETVIASVYDNATGKISIIRSVTGGNTWGSVASIFPPDVTTPDTRKTSTLVWADKGNGASLWMLTVAGESRADVYTSSDDGVTWVHAFDSSNRIIVRQAYGRAGKYGVWVAQEWQTGQVVFSLDDGASWRFAHYALARNDLSAGEYPSAVASGPYGLCLINHKEADGSMNRFVPGFKVGALNGFEE